MSIKLSDILVVCDMDGTLLEAGHGLPKVNIEAVESFIAKGGNFTLATGRGIDSVGYYTNLVKFTHPAILCNGGIMYDYKKEQLVFDEVMEQSVVEIITDVSKRFSNVGVVIMKQKENYSTKMNKHVSEHFTMEHLTYTMTDITAVPSGWNKVLFAGDESYIDKVEQYFNENYVNTELSKTFNFSRTNELYYEIMPTKSTKENALAKLCEMFEFDIKKVITIGNYYSDIGMFKASGYSIAVDNSPEDVKSEADLVVASCLKGGVAEAIEYIEKKYQDIL